MFRDIASWEYSESIEDKQTLGSVVDILQQLTEKYGKDCPIHIIGTGDYITIIYDEDSKQLLFINE